MQTENPSKELLFVYSEPQMVGDRFAIGLVPKEAWAEVREDYIEPILVGRFPLNLLHPESVVHLLREGPLSQILSAGPTGEGMFVAVLPRRISVVREATEEVLRQAGFAPLDEAKSLADRFVALRWQLEVKAGGRSGATAPGHSLSFPRDR